MADASQIISPTRHYASLAEYLDDDSRTDRLQVVINGKAYNVADLEAVQNLTEESLPTPLSGASGTIAIGVRAHATAENAVALGLDARAVGANAVAIGAGVTAGADEVVIGLPTHAYKLPGVAASQTDNPEVLTVDNTGRLASDGGALHQRVQKLETDVQELDQEVEAVATSVGNTNGSSGSSGDTVGTLPGTRSNVEGGGLAPIVNAKQDPGSTEAVVQQVESTLQRPATSVPTVSGRAGTSPGPSDDEGSTSVATVEALETSESGSDGKGDAPETRSGSNSPATGGNHHVVADDSDTGGSVSPRPADLPELSALSQRMNAYDERLNALDERLDGATAMSSALSALPNTVPDGGKLFLGLGVGHYGDQQAIALGLSARLGTQGNVFVNAGVATATGGNSVSARAGVGFVWK